MDFGGILMSEDRNEALWYYFTDDVFRVLARLQIWSKLNPMPVFFQVIPLTLLVDYNLHTTIKIADEFAGQSVNTGDDLEIYVHPQFQDTVKSIPGLSLELARHHSGLSKSGWMLLDADQGLGYESLQSWYFVIIPVGNPSDKEFIRGWRAFFSEIQVLLQRLGLQYMTSDLTVIFPISSLTLLKTYLKDLLILIKRVRNNEGEEVCYWPSVMALIPGKGLNFNDEIPRKANLDWDKLTPDSPHLKYRDAYLLGKDFVINEVRFGSDQESLDSWCMVSLSQEHTETAGAGLEVTISRRIAVGENDECFYCGMKNHLPAECPSKSLANYRGKIWKNLAVVDVKDFTSGFQNIDLKISSMDNPLKGFSDLLLKGNDVENILIRSLFAINAVAQLRILKLVWKSRGKDWPKGIFTSGPEEGEFIWTAVDFLKNGDLENAESLVKRAMLRYSRSYQPRSLMGFIALEQGDDQQAMFYWQEAERLSYSPLQQSYLMFLQGRLLEVTGQLNEASTIYKRIGGTSPNWLEPQYRRCVCMVKMGFAEQAVGSFEDLIREEPLYFNRILIDPEMDRGRIVVLQALSDLWREAETEAKAVAEGLEKLSSDISQWFTEGHEFADEASNFMERMDQLTKVNNYVAFQQLITGVARLTDEIEKRVDYEIRVINKKVEIYFERLKEIQGEASWFPFPKLLTDFNKDFNYCAEKINWIKSQHLKVAETFRKTQKYLDEIDDRLQKLKSRLVTLRVVRDSTLFVMLLGRTFIWLEVIFLGLALLCVPLLAYYAKSMGSNFIIDIIIQQKWEFQKGLIIIMSILALALSAFRAAVVFDKRKKELFEPADSKR
jgi:tetratricopeptide (TPR) repeat protein/uncharacterized membrane protein (DUF485 family)